MFLKTIRLTMFTFVLALHLVSCPSAPAAKKPSALQENSQTEVSARQSQAARPAYWTGDGGRGISLAVLEPAGRGITQNEQWMLSLIQSSITGDFNKYSAMTIIDRQNLETILKEQLQSISGNYSDYEIIKIGHLTNAKYILGGSVSRTTNAFMLELAVTDVESGVRKASLTPTPVTPAALENLSAVKEASAELLRQLGVNLTSAGLTELKKPLAISQVNAEAALARGVIAQRQGTEVAALSYFFQAASLDTSLVEAANRSSTMSANISSGNIGMNIRNDIVWRREWVARLTEAENFFNNVPPPYTLFYSTGIETGAINYQTETAVLSIPASLRATGHDSLQRALQVVYDGLNATRRKDEWGLANWPQQSVTGTNMFASQKQYNLQIVFELVNERNQVIGRQTVTMRPGFRYTFNNNRMGIEHTGNIFNNISFNAVKADDISDSLTIRIASINNAAPQTAQFQITALTGTQWTQTGSQFYLRVERGELKGFNSSLSASELSQYRNLVIPSTGYWGEPLVITSIGIGAFRDKQLTGVTIPNSVTSIGDYAFWKNRLTNVTVPNNLTTIGNFAFHDNPIISITIGANVRLGTIAFGLGFEKVYKGVAGTYNYDPDIANPTAHLQIRDGEIIGFNSSFSTSDIVRHRNLVIPSTGPWGEPLGITSIRNFAFSDKQLTGITIPNGITSIGNHAFYKNQLTSVTIPNSVTKIGNGAFKNNQLTAVTIPNSVTTIENNAFEGNLLTAVTIPNSVTTIKTGTFVNNRLTSVTIPSSVTTIGDSAFSTNRLTSVTIPNSVRSIGALAFSTNQLTSITIGANVSLESWQPRGITYWPFNNGFDQVYINGGRQAGTYIQSGNTWVRR